MNYGSVTQRTSLLLAGATTSLLLWKTTSPGRSSPTMCRPDETAFSLSDILEMGLENARKEGHLSGNDSMPKLYSDNGSGFASKFLAEYLSQHGIKHIFGTPYHPQGRGKIERFNRRIKEKLCLVVYCSPDELKKAVDQAIATYNSTPHESLDNVSPNDVYAGRKEAILQRRKEKKTIDLGTQKAIQS